MNLVDLVGSEPAVRFGSFFFILSAMIVWEQLNPRRPLHESKGRHDIRNLSLVLLNLALTRILAPILPLGFALVANRQGWGLFNLVDIIPWIALILSVLALDLIIYFQHVMFHAIPALWRLHLVHHADVDFTATTGLRFHPLEILLSTGVKLIAVFLLGPPAAAVLAFEVILNGAALFNHGNVSLPPSIDRLMRLIIVTPDMHRVHHSTKTAEANRNFGFNFPWWDRLFGTYQDQPMSGHLEMRIGVKDFSSVTDLTIEKLLIIPFKRKIFSSQIPEQEDSNERPHSKQSA